MPPRRRTTLALLGLLSGLLVTVTGSPARAELTVDEVYPVPSNGVYPVEGHGWGHGRGMSQYGAQGASTLGKSADTITSFYYPHTAKASQGNVPMRVWLQADTDNRTEVYPATGLKATDAATGAALTLPGGYDRWRTTVDSAGLHLQGHTSAGWSGSVAISGKTAFAGPLQYSGPTFVRVAFPDGTSRDYRGVVKAVRTSSTTAITVDALPMESYLLGVVPRESPSSWGASALQAQAIAARTYSEYKREHVSSSALYDICDTTQCQVFGGSAVYDSSGAKTSLEPTSSTQAVQATAGVIRTYGGKAVFSEFSASNGGWSTDGGQPYLIAQRDDWDGVTGSSVHYWKATVSAAQLQARYPSVGTLKRLRVTLRDGNGDWGGRVKTVVLEGVSSTGAATSVSTTGAGVYYAHTWPAYSDGLRSTWWHITSPTATAPVAPDLHYTAMNPVRALDTRTGTGAPRAKVGPGGTVSLQVLGANGIPPSGVSAVAVNVTAVGATANGYVSVYPSGQTRPTVSNLNTTPGRISTNLVVARLGGDGRITLYNSGGTVDLVGDIAGYYGTSGDTYASMTPVRALDTRTGTGAPKAKVGPGGTVSLQVTGANGVPSSGVTAVVLNVTATNATSAGYVTAYPTGTSRPGTSSLNTTAGAVSTDLVIARLGTGGKVTLYNSGGTVDLIGDVEGYYTSTTSALYQAMSPVRMLDTRTGTGAPRVKVGPGGTLTLQVEGSKGVPSSGVTAVVLNVTAVNATSAGYVSVYPAGQPRPPVSNLSTVPGLVSTNLVVVRLSGSGQAVLYNSAGTVDLVADVAGYYT
ncbi:MAG: SpoIID/LytB domain-containing protein [Mycobacteriales bacterium]